MVNWAQAAYALSYLCDARRLYHYDAEVARDRAKYQQWDEDETNDLSRLTILNEIHGCTL